VRQSAGGDARRADLRAQLDVLLRRASLLRTAIILASLSLLFAALLIITLFVAGFAQQVGAVLVVALFVLCMASLIGSLVSFIRDLNVSLAALDLEVRSARPPAAGGQA
jgi:hypothetical protein